jgi:hypothetical protein
MTSKVSLLAAFGNLSIWSLATFGNPFAMPPVAVSKIGKISYCGEVFKIMFLNILGTGKLKSRKKHRCSTINDLIV